MPDHNVIQAVSTTLETVLTTELSTLMVPAPTAEVVDVLTPGSGSGARVSLFLYEIVEDPSQRNRPMQTSTALGSVSIQRPPMALLLRYMVTPWSGDWQTDQRMLARVLQVFYDRAILSGPDLLGVLAGTDEALKITLAPISLEDRSRVWYAVQQPYRLSLTYEVRVVNLEALDSRTVPAVASAETRRAEKT